MDTHFAALPMGDGTHYLVVGKEIRDRLAVAHGDTVRVVLELDAEERHVEVPEELRQALARQPLVAEAFEKMTYSHKKEWINWILSAKKPETRQRRIEKALTLLVLGKNVRDVSRRR